MSNATTAKSTTAQLNTFLARVIVVMHIFMCAAAIPVLGLPSAAVASGVLSVAVAGILIFLHYDTRRSAVQGR